VAYRANRERLGDLWSDFVFDVPSGEQEWAGGPPATCELPPRPNVAAMSEIGALFGDPARVRMLCKLAKQLADSAGVTPQTASGHIAKLVIASLVSVERRGRQRLHRLAAAETGQLLSLFHRIGVRGRSESRPVQIVMDVGARLARTCYDHLGGALGAKIADALAEPPGENQAVLRAPCPARLREWGVQYGQPPAGRLRCAYCQDWPDEALHIGGQLGAAILQRSLELDWVRLRPASRSLTITHVGSSGFREVFGVRLP